MGKITSYDADAAPSSDDLIITVNDPAGTPVCKKVTIGDLFKSLPDGSAAAPSLAFASDPDTGMGLISTCLSIVVDGNVIALFRRDLGQDALNLQVNNWLVWSNDLILSRDAANTLALKNANNEQQFNIYSGNGAYGLIKSKQELVTTTAAATAATAAAFIPDGAIPLAISTYVQTAITTAGLTGYNIGDGADADRWGAIAGDIVGTKSNNSDWTATTIQAFIAAQAITLTAVGANFPAGGKIRVCMTYIASSEPTS